jgi:1-deoxy-D-xylulose-5-phosphate reductoisomerase
LAIEAGKQGGTAPAVLAAADEAAVELFLAGRIGFTYISRLIDGVLEQHHNIAHPSLEDITAAGDGARREALTLAGEIGK